MRGKKFPRIVEVMERLRGTNPQAVLCLLDPSWSFADQFNVT